MMKTVMKQAMRFVLAGKSRKLFLIEIRTAFRSLR